MLYESDFIALLHGFIWKVWLLIVFVWIVLIIFFIIGSSVKDFVHASWCIPTDVKCNSYSIDNNTRERKMVNFDFAGSINTIFCEKPGVKTSVSLLNNYHMSFSFRIKLNLFNKIDNYRISSEYIQAFRLCKNKTIDNIRFSRSYCRGSTVPLKLHCRRFYAYLNLVIVGELSLFNHNQKLRRAKPYLRHSTPYRSVCSILILTALLVHCHDDQNLRWLVWRATADSVGWTSRFNR